MMKYFVFFQFCIFFAISSDLVAKETYSYSDKFFQHHDGNKDGKVSRDEFLQHFKNIDANGDGFVDRDELKKYLESKKNEHHKGNSKK